MALCRVSWRAVSACSSMRSLSCFCSSSPWTTVGLVSPLASGLSLTKEGGTAHRVQRLGCREHRRERRENEVQTSFSTEQALFTLIVTAHLCVFMRGVVFWTLQLCFSKDYGTATLWTFNLEVKPSGIKWKPPSFENSYFITGYGSSILVYIVILIK